MKRGHKWLALLLAIVMVVSMIPTIGAAEAFKKTRTWSDELFADVPKDQWYYETIKEAFELSLMSGDTGGTFRPDGLVTLAETVTVAARIHAIAETGKESFVQGEPWYKVYVDYALENGILTAELTDYNRAATREEFARILAKALPAEDLKAINTVETGAIPDVKDDEDIYLLYRAGVLGGNDDKGTFAPMSNIKRSEVAAIVARMALPELRKEFTLTVPKSSQGTSAPVGGNIGTQTPSVPSEPIDPEDFIDETNALTQPFDIVYPEVFESGAVEYSGEQIMIKLASDTGLSAGLQAAGITAMEKIMEISSGVWYKAYITGDVKEVMAAVRELSEVLVAEYDYAYETEAITDCTSADVDSEVHKNKDYKDQWYLCSCGIQKGWGHLKHHHHHGPKPDDTDQGDENVGIAGEGIVVAVIDTGVDYNHEDLKDSMWVNVNEIPDNGIDDDGNDYVDDYYGVNVVAKKGNGDDDNGHGTHVAGIIAAADNNLGIVGIAYNAKIMSVKAGMASGFFNQSDIAKAVTYAYEHGADVINMSFGGSAVSIAVIDALEAAYTNCVLVASAGNDGAPNEGFGAIPNYPAALSYVLGVMSVDENGVESGFTNYDVTEFSSVEYELYAPGEAMLSTIPGNRYAKWNGTSMAAPVVSAMAALLRAEFYDRGTYPTKFIYGQLSGTGTQTAICLNPNLHGKHNLPKIVDLYQAMTVLPKPEVGVSDYVIFDTPGLEGNEKNNGDGVIDAGETIAIGFTLRNRWGKTGKTVVSVDTLSQEDIPDPYVTILNNDVNYGSVGTYSTQNAGWLKDADGVYIGWENPIYLQISEDCPNDYIVKLNVVTRSTNGLDAADTAMYESDPVNYNLKIRKGEILPEIVTENMTLTATDYYIIPNSMYIAEGATVTVEAGTQIQFWTDDPNDTYADVAITYLKVAGEFVCKGTEDDPVRLFPSEFRDRYRVEITETGNGVVELYHTEVVNGYLDISYAENCEFSQNYRAQRLYYRYLSGGVVNDTNRECARISIDEAKKCAFYKLGGNWDPTWSAPGYYTVLVGSYDGCIFVDSDLTFNGTYANCVFLGNNNYLDEAKGGVSDITIRGRSSSNSIYNSVFKNPETGTTYLYLGGSANMQDYAFFADWLGGQLLKIETEEEWNYLLSVLSGKNEGGYSFVDVAVDLIKDPNTGAWTWKDGSALGDFLPVKVDTRTTSNARISIVEKAIYVQSYGSGAIIEIPAIGVEEITMNQYVVTLDTESEGYQISASTAPIDVSREMLIYESENPDVATVSDTGFVKGVSLGETVIRVYSPDRYVFNTVNVTVTEAVGLTGVYAGEDFWMNIGTTHQLTPILTPENTSQMLLAYESSAPEVASVTAAGLVKALSAGTTEITVTNLETGISDTVSVTVIIPVTAITTEETICITDLTSKELAADVLGITFVPADTTERNLLWESSNPEIVSVDEDGYLLKGSEPGYATLRATVAGTELYAEAVLFLSERDGTATVKQYFPAQTQGAGGNMYYHIALLSDGSLWYWSDDVTVPAEIKLNRDENAARITQIALFSYGNNSRCLAVLDADGNLNIYRENSDKPVFFADNSILGGSSVSGVMDITGAQEHMNGRFAFLKSEGSVWLWTSGNALGQAEITEKIVDIEFAENTTSGNTFYMLDQNGDVHVYGREEINASGVNSLYRINGAVCKQYTSDVVKEYAGWYLDNDGILWAKGDNAYGQLGNGTTERSDTYCAVKKVSDVSDFFVYKQTVYIQTENGRFYGVGRNEANQIPNLSEGNQTIPSRIYFGMEVDAAAPEEKSVNLTDGILNEGSLIVDFSHSLLKAQNYGTITLSDVEGSLLGSARALRLNQLVVTPFTPLTEGTQYTLTIPAGALKNALGIENNPITVAFKAGAYTAEDDENEKEENDGSDSIVAPEIHETQINPDATPRPMWTVEYVQECWTDYSEYGKNPSFHNNAILNRLNREDKVEDEWLRLVGYSTSAFTSVGIAGNYWGTTSKSLINNQIVDFNDYQQYANLNEGEFLTTAPENVWPFAVKAGLLDKNGDEVEVVGNETLTFYVEFNRDMDPTIPLDVRFGSAYPYADYAVEGKWVSARRWEGKTTLTTLIEGGYQFWSIDNGRAADAPLKLYKDWGRFPFEIDTTSAQAMILQASADANGINLSWYQDDFDTLAGYNVYRSNSEDGQYERLNKTVIPADVTTFQDTNVEPGVVYYYNFTVVETDMSESVPSGKTQCLSLDTMAPNLYHTVVFRATAGRNLVISATATDNLQIRDVTLYYRTVGVESWNAVQMTALDSKYSAVIGSNLVTTAGIEYYIVASDGVGTTSRGSAADPYVVTVQEPMNADSLGDVNGDGTIAVVDALLIMEAINDRYNMPAEEFRRADLNGDEELSSSEALRILQYVNGQIGSLNG